MIVEYVTKLVRLKLDCLLRPCFGSTCLLSHHPLNFFSSEVRYSLWMMSPLEVQQRVFCTAWMWCNKRGVNLSLKSNYTKSEIISASNNTSAILLSPLQGVSVIDRANATLLGSPVGDVSSNCTFLRGKGKSLENVGERLKHLMARCPPSPLSPFHYQKML